MDTICIIPWVKVGPFHDNFAEDAVFHIATERLPRELLNKVTCKKEVDIAVEILGPWYEKQRASETLANVSSSVAGIETD